MGVGVGGNKAKQNKAQQRTEKEKSGERQEGIPPGGH